MTETGTTKNKNDTNFLKIIPRYYIKKGVLTREHVRDIIGVDHIPLDEEVDKEFQERSQLKKQLKDWSRNRIRQEQFEEAINQGMKITSWEEIKNACFK